MNKAIIIFFLLGCVVAGMVSCGGTNSTLVIISPSAITLTTGGTQQFTANIPVTWSVSGDGVINSAGFFIAGGTPGAATVTATATDKVSNNSAVVTVVATGTTTTTTTGVSGLKHRVFVSNAFPGTLNAGALNIIDADKDQLSAAIITLGGSPNFMVQSADQKGVVVFDSSSNILRLVADSAEAVAGAVQLPGATSSMLVGGSLAGNNVAAYAAVPTAHVFDASHNVVTGAVYLAQFSGSTPLMSAGVQGAKAVAGGTITVITTVGTTTTTAFYNNFLVFSQNCDTVTALQNGSAGLALNTLGTVNGGAACPVNDGTGTFSRPVGGVFAFSVDANNNVNATTAYVLSSGAANGGTQAKVTKLDMTPTTGSAAPPVLPAPPTVVGAPLAVTAAQVGLLQGTTLYVAGEDPANPGNGVLTVVDTTTFTAGTPIKLDNNGKAILGIPKVMAADSNGNIWIGSTGNCAITTDVHGLTQPPGCLHVYNPTSGQVFANTPPQAFFAGLSDATDDVSSMVWLNPLNGRNVMYVVEGGEVVPYGFDGSTLAPSACAGTQDQPCIIDIVGQAVDVKAAF